MRRSFAVVLVLVLVLVAVLLTVTRQWGAAIAAGSEVVPLALLAMLAYASGERPRLRVLAIIWLAVVTLAFAVLALSNAYDALLPAGVHLTVWQWRDLPAEARGQLGRILVGIAAGAALGWLCYLPVMRRPAARLLPLRPGSFVDSTALVVVVSGIIMFFTPLVVLGRPPFLISIEHGDTSGLNGSLLGDLYNLAWEVPGAILAVGYPLARTLPRALDRLGLVRPSWMQVGLGLLAGALLVPAVGVLDGLIDVLWHLAGWTTTDNAAFDQLMQYSLSPVGAVVVGLTAGLGEELAVRGVLQPRLGIVLADLFFAALHAFQYNFDAVLSVFVIGLVLGLIRRYSNTTTSAITHGTYDFLLTILSIVAVPHWLT